MAETDVRKMTPEEKEAYHREAEGRIKVIRIKKPENKNNEPRDVVVQYRTNLISVLTQWVRKGGEDNLHYHTNGDTYWYVIKGRARYYTKGDVLLADLGPSEGIVIPAGSRYWFETASDEELELLQVVAAEKGGRKAERINASPHKPWMTDPHLQVYDK